MKITSIKLDLIHNGWMVRANHHEGSGAMLCMEREVGHIDDLSELRQLVIDMEREAEPAQ